MKYQESYSQINRKTWSFTRLDVEKIVRNHLEKIPDTNSIKGISNTDKVEFAWLEKEVDLEEYGFYNDKFLKVEWKRETPAEE